jgi:hypothetical protein
MPKTTHNLAVTHPVEFEPEFIKGLTKIFEEFIVFNTVLGSEDRVHHARACGGAHRDEAGTGGPLISSTGSTVASSARGWTPWVVWQ